MNGRSRRSEFWWTMLVVGIASIILSLIPYIGYILSLLLGLCTVPLMMRRLHDTGKDHTLVWIFYGVYAVALLLSLIGGIILRNASSFSAIDTADTFFTIAGVLLMISGIIGIVLIVFWVQDSQPFPNKYGPSPKYPGGQPNAGYQQPYNGQQQYQQPQYGQQQYQQPQYGQQQYQQPQQPQYPPQQQQYQQPQQPQYPPQQPQYPPQQQQQYQQPQQPQYPPQQPKQPQQPQYPPQQPQQPQ
ncbi:MAG: DUF805 domain-containing protein [Prevotella sp.]|nr:DUF805 domain-containing protein [Prevotella sp.]